MKRILLIRHGQTDWNTEGRWQGHLDVSLNDEGFEQARALAGYLRDRPIRTIYISDLLRARQTAAPLAEALGLTPILDPRWRELNLGGFQGLTTSEIGTRFPDESRRMREDYLGFAFPQGETRRQLQQRALEAFREITAAPEHEVAVVTHGGTIRVLLMRLFETSDEIPRISLYNTSISTIVMEDDRFQLIESAATPHLLDGRQGI